MSLSTISLASDSTPDLLNNLSKTSIQKIEKNDAKNIRGEYVKCHMYIPGTCGEVGLTGWSGYQFTNGSYAYYYQRTVTNWWTGKKTYVSR